MKVLSSLILAVSAFAAAPTDKDALGLKDAQLRVLQAAADLDRILKDPVIIRAQAAVLEAQAALKAEQDKHPGCELQAGNTWKCAEKEKAK